MVALCPAAQPLVEAAKALDAAGPGAAGSPGGAGAGAGGREAEVYEAWLSSLLKDGDALAQKGLDTAHNKLEDEVNKPANALKGKPGE
jgi:hypothetical protein